MGDTGASRPRGIAAPAWGRWLLIASVPIALLALVVGLLGAVLVVPLFDLTPLVIAVVSFVGRRWRGAARTLLTICAWLALLLLAEWLLWDAWFVASLSKTAPDVDFMAFWGPYFAQVLALLVTFVFAAVWSFVGMGQTASSAAERHAT